MSESLSEKIVNYEIDYANKYDKGLVILEVPTSGGKTYAACEAIAKMINQGIDKKIVFMTSRIKNLPDDKTSLDENSQKYTENGDKNKEKKKEDWYVDSLKESAGELRKAFKRNGLDYDSLVITVRSNEDCIRTALADEKIMAMIPKKVKDSEVFSKMKDCIKNIDKYNNLSVENIKAKILQSERQDFGTYESLFRFNIRKEIIVKAKGKKCSAEEIFNTDRSYDWVKKIYPQEECSKYKVFLMTARKLKEGGLTIAKRISFFSKKWLEDKIIFADEIDAIKEDFEVSAINQSLMNKSNRFNEHGIDILYLFKKIVTFLNNKKSFSKIANESCKKEKKDELLEKARTLTKKYHLDNNFKSSSSETDENRQFFFYKSNMWLTVKNKDNRKNVWALYDKKNERMEIKSGTKDEYTRDSKGKGFVDLFEMLSEVQSFISYFIYFFNDWVAKYKEMMLKDKEYEDYISEENAASSLLKKFYGDNVEQRFICNYALRNFRRSQQKTNRLRPHSYYSDGVTLFSFVNENNHVDDTLIEMFRILETPESMLLFLSENSLVIGFSATAMNPSVIGNFSMRYIKEELNRDGNNLYHDVIRENPELNQAIVEKTEQMNSKYTDGQIGINVNVLNSKYDEETYGENILDVCWDIQNTKDEELKKLSQKIKSLIDKELDELRKDNVGRDLIRYVESRYYNIAMMIKIFSDNYEHQSCLCLSSKLPKDGDHYLNEKTLDHFVEEINEYHVKKDAENYNVIRKGFKDKEGVLVLNSNNYIYAKNKFFTAMKNGKGRVFLISSYSTIAAGQNLQYEYNKYYEPFLRPIDGMGERKGNDKDKKKKRDFDEICFLDITNIVVNTESTSHSLTKDDVFRNIIQSEECYAEFAISLTSKNHQIKTGLKKEYDRWVNNKNVIRNSDQHKYQITKWIIQAVGRIVRTPIRTRKLTVCITDKMLEALDNPYMKEYYPKANSILRKLYDESTGQMPVVNNKWDLVPDYIREGEKKDNDMKQKFGTLLTSIRLDECVIDWSQENRDAYMNMRKYLLAHPCGVTEEEIGKNEFYRNYYFPWVDNNGKDFSQYCAYSEADWGTTYIAFDVSEGNLRSYINRRHEQDNVAYDYDSRKKICVSVNASGLDTILLYPGMMEWLHENGVATSWNAGNGTYGMTPYAFKIYKGILGEVAGQYIIRKELGLDLSDIDDLHKFEGFDFVMKDYPKVFVDFKHWNGSGLEYADDFQNEKNEAWINKNKQKMSIVGADTAFIVGIIENDGKSKAWERDNIVCIPSLIDKEGNPVADNIAALKDYLNKSLSKNK